MRVSGEVGQFLAALKDLKAGFIDALFLLLKSDPTTVIQERGEPLGFINVIAVYLYSYTLLYKSSKRENSYLSAKPQGSCIQDFIKER